MPTVYGSYHAHLAAEFERGHLKAACRYRPFKCSFFKVKGRPWKGQLDNWIAAEFKWDYEEKAFKYRPFKCPFFMMKGCPWKGQVDDMLNHVKTQH